MKPRTAKAKGRFFENLCVRDVYETFPELEDGDVLPSQSSDSGKDMVLSPAARRLFPYLVEAKNHKRLDVPGWIRQAEDPRRAEPGMTPVVVFKQHNDLTRYSIIRFTHLLLLRRQLVDLQRQLAEQGATNGRRPEKPRQSHRFLRIKGKALRK